MQLYKHLLYYTLNHQYIIFFYSLLNASTGSFLLAILDGIRPAINVNKTDIITSTIAPPTGNLDNDLILVIFLIIIFIGIFKINVTIIPSIPANRPSIKVSALNTLDTSFLLAPIAL